MSRSQVDGSPKIPNMQAQAQPTQFQPPVVPNLNQQARVEFSGSNQPREVRSEEVLQATQLVGNAVTGYNAELNAKPKRYKVTREGAYKPKGCPERYRMYEGKIIDNANYDIKEVQSQGIRLVEVDDDGEPLPKKE